MPDFRLKCTQFAFHGAPLQTPLGELTVFMGHTSKGREGNGEEGEKEGRKGKGRGIWRSKNCGKVPLRPYII